MEEKEDAFTIRAFGQRVGISKDILSRCINGERYIKPSELKVIAAGLNLTERRIKQEDINGATEELHKLLTSMTNPSRALELAQKLAHVSLGCTEKSIAFNNHGRALFVMQKYEKAHHAWLDAYSLAKKQSEKYGETEVLHRVLTNLLISYTMRKEYTRLDEIIQEIEPILFPLPERAGAICYSLAMILYQKGELEPAREKLYESYNHYLLTDDVKSVGMAERNVAYIEFVLKNYTTSKQFFEKAIPKLAQDVYWQLVAIKDYVKALIQLRELQLVEQIIEESLERLHRLDKPELEGKFHLLLARANDNVEIAKQVLEKTHYGTKVHQLACKYILNHYSRVGDANSLLHFFRLAEGLMINHSDILEEDDL